MKVAAGKTKKWLVGLSSCLVVAFALLPAATASADTFPYLKEYGGDVAAGGWFNGGATGGCVASPDNYQYPGYNGGNGTSNLTGGILTYANTTGGAGGGASSQYGAFALGNIDSSSAGANSGFYSGGSQPGGAVNRLSFANIGFLPNSSGGNLGGGGEPTDQCIPDYFGTLNPSVNSSTIQPPNPQSFLALSPNASGCPGSGVYYIDATTFGGTYNLNQNAAQDVCPGENIAVIVKGNVLINNDIHFPSVYTDTSTYDVNNVPKFAVVASGNIYVTDNVGHMDGWYIAQPNSSNPNSTGVIWDCVDPANPTVPGDSLDSSFILSNCTHPLVIQGALTAKHVNFLRIGGTVTNASAAEDSGWAAVISNCDQQNPTACNVGEVINYPPAMVLGGPFFDLPTSGAPNVEQLKSLPPVF